MSVHTENTWADWGHYKIEESYFYPDYLVTWESGACRVRTVRCCRREGSVISTVLFWGGAASLTVSTLHPLPSRLQTLSSLHHTSHRPNWHVSADSSRLTFRGMGMRRTGWWILIKIFSPVRIILILYVSQSPAFITQ